MKYFVISDIHSYYSPMKEALDKAGFDPKNESHTLVLAGDLFDRGDDTKEVYKYIRKLPRKILVRGNHEDMFEDMVNRGFYYSYDVHNGAVRTICDLNNKEGIDYDYLDEGDMRIPAHSVKTRELVKWIDENYVDYAEFSKFIVVHSYLPTENIKSGKWDFPDKMIRMRNWRKAGETAWEKSRWGNPYDCMRHIGGIPKGKKLIVGHWHVSYAWFKETGTPEFKEGARFDTWEGDNLIMIDACTAISGKCNVFVFEDDKAPKLGKTKNQWKNG